MGALKQKKCKNIDCMEFYIPWTSTQQACSMLCAIKFVKQKEAKKYKAETVQMKRVFNNSDLSHQKQLTQDVFNKLRKLQEYKWFADRGLEPECISCGKKNMDWCCSHLKTVKSQGALRFDKDNTKLACNRYCNKGLSGNINGNRTTRGYLVGLAERFGKAEAKRIIDYCEIDRIKTWTCQELIAMRKEFNAEIRLHEQRIGV